MTDDAELTVGQTARLVGVSVRTLHHWDEIGLVSPSARSQAGYRLYGSDDVARIHQVLVYRETGMGLSDIAVVLADPSTQAEVHLLRQRELLTRRLASQSKDELAAAKEHIEWVEERLAQALREGVEPGSERANALAEEHRASLSWFDVTRSKHVLIACSFVDDPRFRAHYDEREPGLARWLKDVVDANAAACGIDPATVQWE